MVELPPNDEGASMDDRENEGHKTANEHPLGRNQVRTEITKQSVVQSPLELQEEVRKGDGWAMLSTIVVHAIAFSLFPY